MNSVRSHNSRRVRERVLDTNESGKRVLASHKPSSASFSAPRAAFEKNLLVRIDGFNARIGLCGIECPTQAILARVFGTRLPLMLSANGLWCENSKEANFLFQ